MGKLRFSVIVPVYNKAAYLSCSFCSILSQLTYEDELILVDDGSSDGSERICDEYSAKYENVKVIHQVNQGVSAARNNGIRASSGRYLMFIDCDDTIETGLIDKAVSFTTTGQLMIFGMSFDYYNDSSLTRSEVLSYTEDCIYTRVQVSENLNELFLTNSLSSACNKVFLRHIIKDNGILFNEKMYLYEDLDFVLQYLSCVDDQIHIVKYPYYHYRLSASQMNLVSRVSDLHKLIGNMNELKKGFDHFGNKTGNRSMTDQMYMGIYLDLIYRHLIDSNDLKSSISTLFTEFEVEEAQYIFDGNREVLLDCIKQKDTKKLKSYIHFKKLKRTIRRTAKRILGK